MGAIVGPRIEEDKGAAKLMWDVLENLESRAVPAASPEVQGEIGLIIESYRRFVRERLWEKTSRTPDGETPGRHGLLHGITLSEDYGTRYNFSRLVSILDLFCLLITLIAPPGKRLSILAPDETDESRELANYLGFAAFGRFATERALMPKSCPPG